MVVTKIDRLARSTLHLWEIVKGLEAHGVGPAKRRAWANPPLKLDAPKKRVWWSQRGVQPSRWPIAMSWRCRLGPKRLRSGCIGTRSTEMR